MEAAFLRKLNQTERFFSNYFVVGYYGKGFPEALQNKEFVFKGFELERVSDFQDRMKKKFPKAEFITSEAPAADLSNSEGQCKLQT